MPSSLRLYRRPMYERLERLAAEWDKLTYCRFCIQAEREVNPDWLDDLDFNFSALESIRGYSGRELMLATGRPDRNLTTYFTTIRNQWNNDPAHHYVQLYVVRHEGIVTRKPTKEKPERSHAVIYNFLETLRGRGAVGDVVRRFDDGMAGLNEAKDRIRDSIRISRVDSAVEQILEENARIQGR
jgi:hypothetical protein